MKLGESSVSGKIKWQEMKQDVEPAPAEVPASFTWFTAAPISTLGMEGGGLVFLRVRHRSAACRLVGALGDNSDNIIPAHADLLYFSEESLRTMLKKLALD